MSSEVMKLVDSQVTQALSSYLMFTYAWLRSNAVYYKTLYGNLLYP